MSSGNDMRWGGSNPFCDKCGCHHASDVQCAESSPPQPVPSGGPEPSPAAATNIVDAISAIPLGEYRAKRYNTGDECKVYLYTDGKSFDIILPRCPEVSPNYKDHCELPLGHGPNFANEGRIEHKGHIWNWQTAQRGQDAAPAPGVTEATMTGRYDAPTIDDVCRFLKESVDGAIAELKKLGGAIEEKKP